MPIRSDSPLQNTPAPLIFIAAGEASGERYGAMLLESIRTRAPQARFFGLGGSQMEAAGCECIVRAEEIAVMGLTEVVRHLPTIYAKYRALVRSIVERRPDIAVLIDFPDVNFRLAKHLHRLGIPVIYFVGPQLWAWKKRRIRWVRERVTKMLVIFPFEESYYRERGVDAAFVGHPLADVPLPTISREEFALAYRLDAAKQWIGLLPGSRKKELRLNLPEIVAAAAQLGSQYEYLLPAAATLDADWIRRQIKNVGERGGLAAPTIHVVPDARVVLHHARASIVASGTATVEAALIGNPFLVVYRLSRLSYAVASRMVKVPHVAMANLIAGARIVPELIQQDCTAQNILRHLTPLLHDTPERATMQRHLTAVRAALHIPAMSENDPATSPKTAIERAAEWVLQALSDAK
jgi:lipid-A-disaccharide synthase